MTVAVAELVEAHSDAMSPVPGPGQDQIIRFQDRTKLSGSRIGPNYPVPGQAQIIRFQDRT
eukprot:5121732-Pyramimonas_sp.AAC.1